MNATENIQLITTFYQAFTNADAETMVACYHDNIIFEDPAFGKLEGERAKNMWRMLIANSKTGVKITFGNVNANETNGSASWVAEYIFSQTGKQVVNRISATFEFEGGKIIKHTDNFGIWKWSKQAFGFPGFLLGWTPYMQAKIQQKTNNLLNLFTEKSSKKA